MKNKIRHLLIIIFAASFTLSAVCADEKTKPATKSFTVSKGGTLEVDISGGDVHIDVWDKNEVFIRYFGIRNKDVKRLSITESDNVVLVKYKPRWRLYDRDVLFEINVPSEFNVELETTGGDIKIDGSLTGKMKGSTSGGDIKITDVSGRVEMKTSGGDIRVGSVKGDVFIKTAGGDIRVGTVSGVVEATNSGGDIRIESSGKSTKAKTAGGDIIVGNVGEDARLTTSGGDIRIKKVSGNADLTTAGGDIELGGAQGFVKAKTAGGNIKLDNVIGSVEAKTAGGDIQVELTPTDKGKSNITTAAGDVRLYVPKTAKVTIDAKIYLDGWWRRRSKEYDIKSDFEADNYVKDEEKEEIRARFVLNGGGETISLKTVNSNIYIKKME